MTNINISAIIVGLCFIIVISSTCNITQCMQCDLFVPDACVMCNNGFQINSNNQCQAISTTGNISHCASYTLTQTCAQCQSGYSLSLLGDSCTNATSNTSSCSEGCKTCTNNICFQCSVGYQMSNLNCILCNISNCATCSGPNTCLFCNGFYQLKNDSCVAPTCEIGYQSSANGLCMPCDPGCSDCTGGTCKSCVTQFYFQSSNCNPCPSYCLSCSSANTCNETSNDFGFIFIDTSFGISLLKCNQGCNSCSANDWLQCVNPIKGYVILNGLTIQCQLNCLTCTNDGKCSQCQPNTFKVSLPDGSDSCLGCSSNCKTCTSKDLLNECVSCFEGFSLVNKTCSQSCSLNCKTCVSAQVCDSCPFNFLLKNGKCLPCILGCKTCSGSISNCVQCVAGTYLKPATKTCEQCQQFCEKCNEKGCISCFNGFFLNDQFGCSATCNLPCATCSSANPNLCLSCILGYNFNPAVPSGCEPVSVFSNTTKACPIGKGRNSASVCVQCTPSNCLYCDGSAPSVCLSCVDGYFKSGNVCAKCSASCRQCNSQQNCFSCVQGFLPSLFDQTQAFVHCLPCKFPCNTCRLDISLCTSCITGYSLSKNKCESDYGYEYDILVLGNIQNVDQQLQTFVSNFQDVTGFVNGLSISSTAKDFFSTSRLIRLLTTNTTNSVRIQGTLSSHQSDSSTLSDEQKAKLQNKFKPGNSIGNLKILDFVYRLKNPKQAQSLPSSRQFPFYIQMTIGIVSAIGISVMIMVFVRVCIHKANHSKQKQIFAEIVDRTLRNQIQMQKVSREKISQGQNSIII